MGRYIWGICFDNLRLHSSGMFEKKQGDSTDAGATCVRNISNDKNHSSVLVLSSSESEAVQSALRSTGLFYLQHASGAGYKILCVIDRLAGAYLLTKGSTFKWDTCGPHAILRALGGGMCDYEDLMKTVKRKDLILSADDIKNTQVIYNVVLPGTEQTNDKCCNKNGIVAFINVEDLVKVMKTSI